MSFLSPVVGWGQIIARNIHKYKKHYQPGGRRSQPGAPVYYPRQPDEPDPPIDPPKLFRVQRIKRVKGTTRIERYILRMYDLDLPECRVAIVKNIPEMNNLLWKVKHLVRIDPIRFPHGEPTEADVKFGYLKENGECVVAKEMYVEDEKLELWQKMHDDPARIDNQTVAKNCRQKWLSGWNGGFDP